MNRAPALAGTDPENKMDTENTTYRHTKWHLKADK